MNASATDQCIILPFQPHPPQPFNGMGLALHFLLGNVLVLHTGFKEMWFGWRTKKIFPQPDTFQRFCRDTTSKLDLARQSQTQNIRFWITGEYSKGSVRIRIFDGRPPQAKEKTMAMDISIDDGLVRFRSQFLLGLQSIGHPMPEDQIQAALWPESVDRNGLDAVGRALETFYRFSAYGGDSPLKLHPFEKAVEMAPTSFMAHDLHGWAFYRNKNYPGAKGAFLTALRINPAGAGAMSGLMWCGIHTKDLAEAMFWSGRKAEACGHDVQAAREAGRRRYLKVNSP